MAELLDISVSLNDVLPRPWRRFRIRRQASFAELHEAIMDATGWNDTHLWVFHLDHFGEEKPIAAPTGLDGELLKLGDALVPDAQHVRLARHLGADRATECRYAYDFGDGWECRILVHDQVTHTSRGRRELVAAEHAWPPDDCGGPPGYAALLDALRTGDDPEGMVAWARDVQGWTGTFEVEDVRARFDR